MFQTYYVIFSRIFVLFLAQNFKTKVLTALKNQLLECLAQSMQKYQKGCAALAWLGPNTDENHTSQVFHFFLADIFLFYANKRILICFYGFSICHVMKYLEITGKLPTNKIQAISR